MSRYTRKGSAELDARIDADMARIARLVAPYSKAGILLGGYGRGEGTPFIHPDGSQSPFNDYDLVVVVGQITEQTHRILPALEARLIRELQLTVDLYPYQKDRLPYCEFSLLNCEMKHGHKVVWGDPQILDAMPPYPVDAIPKHEGSRLLLNRGKLLLDLRLRLAQPEPMNAEEQVRFLKFIQKAWLALGDCALLAAGQYDISYCVKRERIGSVEDMPFRDALIDGYLDAIELKDWGNYADRLARINIAAEFRRVREVFCEFLPWYRKRCSKKECPVLKAMLLNLKWYRWPYRSHPRIRLYEALPELLQDDPDCILLGQVLCCSRNIEQRFYTLQARFC